MSRQDDTEVVFWHPLMSQRAWYHKFCRDITLCIEHVVDSVTLQTTQENACYSSSLSLP